MKLALALLLVCVAICTASDSMAQRALSLSTDVSADSVLGPTGSRTPIGFRSVIRGRFTNRGTLSLPIVHLYARVTDDNDSVVYFDSLTVMGWLPSGSVDTSFPSSVDLKQGIIGHTIVLYAVAELDEEPANDSVRKVYPMTVPSAVDASAAVAEMSTQVFPNPFDRQTTVRYVLSGDKTVRMSVRDLLGRELGTDGMARFETAGEHTRLINLEGAPDGTYLVTIAAADHNGATTLRFVTVLRQHASSN